MCIVALSAASYRLQQHQAGAHVPQDLNELLRCAQYSAAACGVAAAAGALWGATKPCGVIKQNAAVPQPLQQGVSHWASTSQHHIVTRVQSGCYSFFAFMCSPVPPHSIDTGHMALHMVIWLPQEPPEYWRGFDKVDVGPVAGQRQHLACVLRGIGAT
jgi:hypothetical protein